MAPHKLSSFSGFHYTVFPLGHFKLSHINSPTTQFWFCHVRCIRAFVGPPLLLGIQSSLWHSKHQLLLCSDSNELSKFFSQSSYTRQIVVPNLHLCSCGFLHPKYLFCVPVSTCWNRPIIQLQPPPWMFHDITSCLVFQTTFAASPFIQPIYSGHSYKPSTGLGARRGRYIRHGPCSWGSSGLAVGNQEVNVLW